MKHFIEVFLAIVAAIGVLVGGTTAAYNMMDDEYKVATVGWVLDFFGARNNFTTLTTANININYYEREKCKLLKAGKPAILDETSDDLLSDSYKFYEEVKEKPHRYLSWQRPDICIDRKEPLDEPPR